ncbi:helix-turn-helix domain-containing protein [Flagellimonas allohymeniacidonis]|uniref:helix-turn-helix domain-containing protein n=1 Tax=Flagellimonas allohymeniacidonis TaxID=2517819 RepID=UPI0013EE97AE|nr:helix-turn-helix transcriptional regulator [Allomuricauda hymeniacidonis]
MINDWTKAEKQILIEFGEKVRKIRREKGMTQADLVHEAGVHGNMIGRIERGERAANVLQLFKIAKALGVNIDELFDL